VDLVTDHENTVKRVSLNELTVNLNLTSKQEQRLSSVTLVLMFVLG